MKKDDLIKATLFGTVLVAYRIITIPQEGPCGFVKGLVKLHIPGDAATGKDARIFDRASFSENFNILR